MLQITLTIPTANFILFCVLFLSAAIAFFWKMRQETKKFEKEHREFWDRHNMHVDLHGNLKIEPIEEEAA